MAGRDIELIGKEVVDAAVRIHKALGPGLLESVYQSVLSADLARRGFSIEKERYITFEYEGMTFERSLSIDLLVGGLVVVELKAIERTSPVHWKQVLTYLRLMNLELGYLLNFGGFTMKSGIYRVLNNYPSSIRSS